MEALFESEKFIQFFGIRDNEQFEIKECDEVHQLLGLGFSKTK